MGKKLTITDILSQKELSKKRKLATQTLYVKSLDAEVTIQEPTKALVMEASKLDDDEQSDAHVVYNCMIDPNLKENHKELMEYFGCATPYEIVDNLFKPGEVTSIAQQCAVLAGFPKGGSSKNTNVRVVNSIKN